MQHLIVHLLYEAWMGGSCRTVGAIQSRDVWRLFAKKCRNKAKIEASVAEAYILEEVSNFPEKYYTENLPNIYNPPPCYNDGENESNLSLFQGQLGSASASITKQLKNEEWRSIMLYVLTNLVEVQPFIG